MKAIKERICFFAIATGLSVLVSSIVFFLDAAIPLFCTEIVLVFPILVSVFLLGFLIQEYRKYKTAGLIIENRIIHIQSVKIVNSIPDETGIAEAIGGIEVYISCFGILLDSKVIKFNRDGIHLKAVEIGHEFISLTYGTDKKIQKTRILHEAIDNQELQSIVEKFRYETGVVPVITD